VEEASGLFAVTEGLQAVLTTHFAHQHRTSFQLARYLQPPPFHPTCPIFILNKQNSGISPEFYSILIALSVWFPFL
jgi:hypothetical protein